MENKELTFNDLPQVVAQLRDEVMGLRVALEQQLRKGEVNPTVRADAHRRMTVAEAIVYTGLPKGTFYMKLENGTIPALKPGRRWMLYQDELDMWLEANRRGSVPLTADEENEAILNSHRRKPNRHDWNDWSSRDVGSSSNTTNVSKSTPPASSARKANGTDTTNTEITTNAVASTDPANEVNPPQKEEPLTGNKPGITNEQSVFNATDATSSFDRMKDAYGKTGNNEAQAFGVWQQLTEEERTAAFVHARLMQGNLLSRSYLYVYLRDKEWTRAM
ncbi:MAG: helix-turn-helix domain-containing protein [Bacteroidales bacterium]|nr:helix-turn-helix domain-containing protein [Bacteroidales bacterium]